MLLQHLLTFCRVVEAGSFTRAGELLNLSQPAVTRQVAALEAEVGQPLLDRQARHLHLTPAGEVVYREGRRVVAILEKLREEVARLSDPDQGQVSVACVTTTGLFTLPSLLKEFSRRYPGVRFRVWSGRIPGVIDRVLDGEADLGLVTMPVSHTRLECIPLYEEPIIPVAAPEFAATLPRPLEVRHLSELDMILYQAPSRFRTIVEAHLEAAGVVPRVTMEFDNHEAVTTMAKLGYGVAMVPMAAVAEELAEGSLVQLEVVGLPPLKRTTSLILRKEDQARSRAAQNFINLILEKYGGQALG
ncbi:MAG: LysR family transcriptional regulator [Bacillota bacterium]|nr:MAG: hypothetical protein DIU70_01190 [Bacillota bacterium]